LNYLINHEAVQVVEEFNIYIYIYIMVYTVVMHVNYIQSITRYHVTGIMYQSLSISCGKCNLCFILWLHKTEKW